MPGNWRENTSLVPSRRDMEELVDSVTRGNVTEVKVLLASVALALGVYQVVLISVGYGKLRPRFLDAAPASFAHRAVGGTIATLLVVVAVMCLSYFEAGENVAHAAAAIALLVVLAVKVLVIRRWHALGRFLPVLGASVLLLLALTWATSAGDFLGDS